MAAVCARRVYLARVNANIDCCTVDLFPCYPLNVDDPLFPVDGDNFALSTLQCR